PGPAGKSPDGEPCGSGFGRGAPGREPDVHDRGRARKPGGLAGSASGGCSERPQASTSTAAPPATVSDAPSSRGSVNPALLRRRDGRFPPFGARPSGG